MFLIDIDINQDEKKRCLKRSNYILFLSELKLNTLSYKHLHVIQDNEDDDGK